MAVEPVRQLQEVAVARSERASLTCTLTGADGRELGSLTIDLGSTVTHTPEQKASLLYRGASILAEAVPSEDGDQSVRVRWEERGKARPELAIHAVLVRAGDVVDEREFVVTTSAGGGSPRAALGDLVAGYERSLIEEALRRTRGNRARAARLLFTTERILSYRIRQYGIDCSEFRLSPGRQRPRV